MRKINFYNEFHLGDSVFHIHYLLNCLKLNDNVEFEYFIHDQYINEIKNHCIGEDKIKISSISQTPPNSYNSWIGTNGFYFNNKNNYKYNEFYVEWFEYLSKMVNLINPITNKNSMLINNSRILNSNIKHKYDLLFINSQPYSGQLYYNESELNKIIIELSNSNNIITTKKINGIDCTMDFNYNLVQIGNISINIKNIVAINTSPIVNCFNIWNIDNINKFVVLDKYNTYTYNNKIVCIDNINNIKNSLKC